MSPIPSDRIAFTLFFQRQSELLRSKSCFFTESCEYSPVSYADHPDLSDTKCRKTLTLPMTNGEEITLIDYPSAGQEDGHKVSAWIRIRK